MPRHPSNLQFNQKGKTIFAAKHNLINISKIHALKHSLTEASPSIMQLRTLQSLAVLALAAPASSNYCYGKGETLFLSWQIDVVNDVYYNLQCGDGCLANLRGRCGVITSWNCVLNSDGSAHYDFLTSTFCTAFDVTSAMLACTKNEQNIPCSIGG